MDARSHVFFRKSQHSVLFEIPNDVFYEFMTVLQDVNRELKTINGYKLTGDDLIVLSIEDFNYRYLGKTNKLLERLGGGI